MREFGVATKPTPLESHNLLSLCERYQHFIRRVYIKMEMTHPSFGQNLTLAVAVHGVNNKAGPDGIVPTLLLFGALLRISISNLELISLAQKERFRAAETARKELMAITARRRVEAVLKPRSPYLKVPELLPGDMAMVYRETRRRWEGPFPAAFCDGRKVFLFGPLTKAGRKLCSAFQCQP